jgi:CRP-like cAMP-binding protein
VSGSAGSAASRRRFAALAALGGVFTNPNLRRLQLGWAGFMLGDSASAVAMAVVAFEAGGYPAVGIAMVCRLLPAALATPAVTVYGARHRGERVLAVTVAARAAATAAMAAVVPFDLGLLALYALVALDTVAMTAFRPIYSALSVPASRSPGELSASNSATSIIESVSVLAGPLLAAVVLAVWSPTSVFLLTAVGLLIAALVTARIRVPGLPQAGLGAAAGDARGFAHELSASVHVLRSARGSPLVLGLFSAQALVKGTWMVLAPVVALELLRTGNSGVGALQAALGAGGLIGGLGTLALVGRRRLVAPFSLGLALWGPPIALVAVMPDPVFALGVVGILGAGKGLTYVAGLSLLQRMMDAGVLGQVIGLLQTLSLVATGLGAFATPFLIDALGLRSALIAIGALMPVLVVAAWPRLAAIDRAAVGREREIAALRGVPMFAALPPLALEQLAAATVPVAAPAGSDVVRQGDRGDRFYVVAGGLLDVLVDGRPVATLGPGGSFGEIALLRDVPRTATVRARTQVELHALERDDFLWALTGRPAGLAAAGSAVEARLRGRPLEQRLEEAEVGVVLRGDPVEVLGSVPALAALPREALAEIAARLKGVRARPRAEIARQGDWADRLYVVVEGAVELTVDGERVATLGPGDSFGERELVDDAPRTATATARTRVGLLALERADFLAASELGARPGAPGPA